MKKLLLMLILILPVCAFAYTVPYPDSSMSDYPCILDTCFSDTLSVINGDKGTATFDINTRTLTFNNFELEHAPVVDKVETDIWSSKSSMDVYVYSLISNDNDLTVSIIGTNTFTIPDVEIPEAKMITTLRLGNDYGNSNVNVIGYNNAVLNVNNNAATVRSIAINLVNGSFKNVEININLSNDKNSSAFGLYTNDAYLNFENTKLNSFVKGETVAGLGNEFGTNNLSLTDSIININCDSKQSIGITSNGVNMYKSTINVTGSETGSIYGFFSGGIASPDKPSTFIMKDSNLSIKNYLYALMNTSDAINSYIFEDSNIELTAIEKALITYYELATGEPDSHDKMTLNYTNTPSMVTEAGSITNTKDLYNYKYVKISKETPQPAEIKKDEESIIDNKSNLKEAIPLDETESALLDLGVEIVVKTEVEEINMDSTDSVVTEILEKAESKINEELQDNTIGVVVDINLYKEVLGTKTQINELNKEIEVTIKLDESLILNDTKLERVYKVLRIHNEEVDLLDATIDNKGNLHFNTDKFSTYVVTYKDQLKEKNPKTGDNLIYNLIITISVLLTLIQLIIYKKRYI